MSSMTDKKEQAAVSVEDVCFTYGETEVLHNVSFSLPSHSLTAVIGPNGGGKTTLLRLLLGALTPRYGQVRIFGEAPERMRRRIGFVPQSVTYDPAFPVSVLEAAALGRGSDRIFGGLSREDRAAAAQALEAVGLGGLGGRLFAELSGGQRQRAVIAQALCAHPDLLLLDEPTANVDPQTEVELYELFARLTERATVVLVSHNLSIVAAHATHLLCVNRTADLHCTAEGGETHLEPLLGGSLAFVRNENPAHLEHLLSRELETPHHACPDCTAAR